jgi:transposase
MKKNIKTTVMRTARAADVATARPQPAEDGAASITPQYHAVVGLDVGDRQSHYCVLDRDGGVVTEGTVKTTEAPVRVLFEGKGRMRMALEAGTHSPWISRLLMALGHEVLVANPRKLRLIAESDAKHDRADAELLARLAHVGPALLAHIQTRSAQTQLDLTLIRAREVTVQTRTKIVNAVRGMVTSTGHRLPASPRQTFARKATEACPEALQPALLPLLRLVQTLTDEIAAYDRLVVAKARAYPDTEAIQTIHGVGALTAVAFVLGLNNDRSRFNRSRDVGGYLGLKPKQRDSGMQSPQWGITKAGDPLIRRLATQSAQYILGSFGRDSALRR